MEDLPLQIQSPLLEVVKENMSLGFQLPRGIRNGNPGNIRPNSRYVWRGQVTVDPDKYLVFDSPLHGIRAMAIIIVNYIDHYGLNTIKEVIDRWSGDGPMIKTSYANYVASQLAMQTDEPLAFDVMGSQAIEAMIAFENAATFKGVPVRHYYETSYIRRAVSLSHER